MKKEYKERRDVWSGVIFRFHLLRPPWETHIQQDHLFLDTCCA